MKDSMQAAPHGAVLRPASRFTHATLPSRTACSAILVVLLSLMTVPALHAADVSLDVPPSELRIGLGSCIAQWRPQPALRHAAERDPHAFIFLGDNIYADTTSPEVMRSGYTRLAESTAFQRLTATATPYAVWDDHDYGRNDAGRSFPIREEAERVFEEFWEIPENDPRRSRPGIYGVEHLSREGLELQLILLDTRYFRSPLQRHDAETGSGVDGPYAQVSSQSATILGHDQWSWLARTMEGGTGSAEHDTPDLRIIVSSIQVLAEYHGWESWSNFPDELERLLELVTRHSAIPTLFVSGDRHFSEVSSRVTDGRRLVDVTASSINIPYPDPQPTSNKFRTGSYYLEPNTTQLTIRRTPELRITVRSFDAQGETVLRHDIVRRPERGWLFIRNSAQ